MTVIPNSDVYAEQSNLAQKAYNQALGNIQTRRTGLLHQYGMTADTGSTGQYTNYRIDQNSMYGLLQQQKNTQAGDLQSGWNQSTERHIGHQGLGQQGESALRYQQGADSQALGEQFTGDLSGLSQQELDALDSYNNALSQARMNSILAGTNDPGTTTTTDPTKDPTKTTASGWNKNSDNSWANTNPLGVTWNTSPGVDPSQALANLGAGAVDTSGWTPQQLQTFLQTGQKPGANPAGSSSSSAKTKLSKNLAMLLKGY